MLQQSTTMNDLSIIANRLQSRISSAANETEVRDRFCSELRPYSRFDFRLERGNSDARLNNVIIEFKARGLFAGKTSNSKFHEAYEQLVTQYIPRQANNEGKPLHDYIGVAIDGKHYAFVFFERNGTHRHTVLSPLDAEGLYPLVNALQSDKRRAFTAENLLEDFGSDSQLARALLTDLYRHLDKQLQSSESKTHKLFEEWKRLFAQTTNLSELGKVRIEGFLNELQIPHPFDYTRFLFTLHTYNALLLKLIAAEVVATIRFVGYSGFAARVTALSLENMQKEIADKVENASLFRDSNIINFVEGSYFSWYIDNAPVTLLVSIRKALAQLSLYVFPTTREERIQDVVKILYENLVPDALRKNIGEFYTPDWLVDFVLDHVGYTGETPLNRKLLDPCCGSGNFLIRAISRLKSAAIAADINEGDTLQKILRSIIGFDLNPLAVLSARLNYLLYILDILAVSETIEIPIYMADAVYAPHLQEVNDLATRKYRIGTGLKDNIIEIELPEELVQNKDDFGAALNVIDEIVEFDEDEDYFTDYLTRHRPSFATTLAEHPQWIRFLKNMYLQIRNLERQNWDRIWCRIIRNYFASVTIGKVDLIVGNPPWVRWSELPEDYRDIVKPTCEQYDIFSKTPFFGGNELDISGMIAYTVTDRWLERGGILSFVITQVHFQAPSSQGFRGFKLPNGTPIQILEVHDLTQLKPFPKLSNKPAVFSWKLGSETEYPVSYHVWQKPKGQAIDERATLEEAMAIASSVEMAATPLEPDQRWSILPSGSSFVANKLQGGSKTWIGRKGITTDLNGAYFVRLLGAGTRPGTVRVRTNPDGSKKALPLFEQDVECELVYPLLKGAGQIRAFHYDPIDLVAIVPNKTISSIQPVMQFREQYPLAYRYFLRLNKEVGRGGNRLLESRSTWKSRMKPTGAPFYAIYNVGDYTFASYKVVWAEMAKSIVAAVVGNETLPFGIGQKVLIPDHKIYFTATEDEDEAHFLCGMLNSKVVREFVDSFTLKLQVGSVFRHLHLPQFTVDDGNHMAVVELSKLAHSEGTSYELLERLNAVALEIIYDAI